MPNLKDIRTRIESTKNTKKITSAMKLVAAAKLRKAQENIVNLRPYAGKLKQLIADVAISNQVEHPLLTSSNERQKVLVVVLTSDRGLCGGFNSNIIKFTEKFYNKNKVKYQKLDFYFIGKKASDFFSRMGVQSVETLLNLAREISYGTAARVSEDLMNCYVEGEYDEVLLIYNEFKSAITQKVVAERLLPVDVENNSFSDFKEELVPKFIFEPEPKDMITQLLEKHFSIQVYRCMAESVAAEHGARMTAMESATKNAQEFIDRLTLTYNKVRQAAITTELTEICGGAEALKG